MVRSPVAGRNRGVDRIRIFLTVLVILHHTAIVYGGSGGWYWREQPNGSSRALLVFNAINQSYFMGCFFLLAGYYTPGSYERKGGRRYLRDRLLRLGIPLLVYFFVLAPFTMALARTSVRAPLWITWWKLMCRGAFEPGPLWFAEALLLLAGAYSVWRRFRVGSANVTRLPTFAWLCAAAALLGSVSFFVRLWIPVGHEVAWLQLGYFPCYIFLFVAGCATGRSGLLERVTFAQARPWIIVSAVFVPLLPIYIWFGFGHGPFAGGWNSNALFYALWDPFVAWGIILALLWAAPTFAPGTNRVVAPLAAAAYAAYIIHPAIIVGISRAAAVLTMAPLAKFVLVGVAASTSSFLLGLLLRCLPGFRRIL